MTNARGNLFALGSALLFGGSVPFAKLLVPRAGPFVVAALLYLGEHEEAPQGDF